jgi:hypothetical protein
MDGRHRFILQRLKDGFQIEKSTIIEQFLSQERQMSQLNDFFRAEGLPTLTFFYQPPPAREDTDGNLVPSTQPQLFLNVSAKEKMCSKAIYFVRTNPKGVSASIEADVCYGEVPANPLADFDFLLAQVFTPLLTKQDDWGKAQEEGRGEFMEGMNRLHEVLDEAVFSLAGGCRLQNPDAGLIIGIEIKQKSLEKAAFDEDMVAHLTSTLEEWCSQIETMISEDAENNRKEPDDVGPRSELEYWRQ